jgi:hypothetical protein
VPAALSRLARGHAAPRKHVVDLGGGFDVLFPLLLDPRHQRTQLIDR